MRLLLGLADLPWRAVNRVRRSLYRAGVLVPKRLPRPVISVGNLAAGGTGKTPAVISICRHLTGQGLRVAVLTRGYGGSGTAGTVSSFDAALWGDEPVLIKRTTNVDVIVGSERYKNARLYLGSNDCDVFVLDDGFQHLQLHRDFDLVIDAPSSILREGRSALRDATAVIPRRMAVTVPPDLASRQVFAFAGLADNEQFFDSLRRAGVQLGGTRGFRDHHRYSSEDLEALRRDARGMPLVTTAKDAVKIADPGISVAEAELIIDEAVLKMISEAAQTPVPPERRRKRKKNHVLQRIEYVVYRAVARRVTSMSEEGVRLWGTRLGAMMRHVLRGRDRLAMSNLRRVYPQRSNTERRQILDRSWRHFGREALVSIRMQNLELDAIVKRVELVNAHLVDEALAHGRGVILLTAHWGSWEVAGLTMMLVVPRLSTVARALDNELLERDLQKMREKMGAQIINRRRAARALVRGIAGNGVVAMVPDQAVQPKEGILVPFLGRPAWTTSAPAKLALRAGATIVFSFCIPDGLRHRLEFQDPIRTDLLTGEERDPEMLTRRINDVFAERINAQPELWLWMHDRWKGTEGKDGAHEV